MNWAKNEYLSQVGNWWTLHIMSINGMEFPCILGDKESFLLGVRKRRVLLVNYTIEKETFIEQIMHMLNIQWLK